MSDEVRVNLANPDFEYPVLEDGSWFKHVYGWQSWFSDYSGERCPEVRRPTSSSIVTASNGNNYAWFNSVQLFQLPTVIEADKTYKLQIDVSKYSSYTGVFRFLLGAYDSADKYETQPVSIVEATHVTDPLVSQWKTITLQFDSINYPQWIGYPLLVYLWSDKVAVDNVILTKTADAADVVSLTVSAPASAAGSVWPGPGTTQYEYGDEIQIAALKYEDNGITYVFDRWIGDVAYPYQPETTIIMDGNKSIEAVYTEADTQPWDVRADTWVATDALGRELPGFEQCGPPRQDRTFISAYTFWLATAPGMYHEPYDVTKIMQANPSNPNWGPHYAFHFWGEPELGYYKSVDDYVMRKHIYMFDAAGVDVLAFECTNAETYPQANMILCDVMQDLRAKGTKTPQMCFWTNPANSIEQEVYNFFYSKGLYPELWYYLDGKPLILPVSDYSALPNYLKSYFTFRQCWDQDQGQFFWQSGDYTPQDYGWSESEYKAEQTSVAAARHATTNIGRSYHNGYQPSIDQYHNTGLQDQGLFFAEQFERALKLDPEFIFTNTWNEWGSFRYIYPEPVWPGLDHFLGRQMSDGDTFFGDDYNHEYSRDIDPMKDGHTDNYYYQLVANIRKYKGVRPPEVPSGPHTEIIDGNFDQWASIRPEYRDYKRDIFHRNELAWGDHTAYINNTGRNDFVITKVAYDNDYIYFYAQTMHPVTSCNGYNWMLLYIDSDMDHSTGWQGYDYLINSDVIDSNTTTLKAYSAGPSWATVNSTLSFAVYGNHLEIKVPRADIGQSTGDVKFDFHWADNIQQHFDIIEFAINGDSAPDRRFNYRYDSSIRQAQCQNYIQDGNPILTDLDSDCDIDMNDLRLFAVDWLGQNDLADYAALAYSWLEDYTPEFVIRKIAVEDTFETGDFSKANWQFGGRQDWQIWSQNSYQGSFSAKSGTINDNNTTSISLQISVSSDSYVNFHFRVSSETNYDILTFYIDGSAKDSWSGDLPWMLKKFQLSAGTHTLEWKYSKDSSVSANEDSAWIDNVVISSQ